MSLLSADFVGVSIFIMCQNLLSIICIMSKNQQYNFPSVPKYIFPSVPTTKKFANKKVEKLMKELEKDKQEREKDKNLDDKLRDLRRKFEEKPIVKKVKSPSGSFDIEKELEDVSFPSSTSSLDIEKELENVQFPFAKGKRTQRRRTKKATRGKKGTRAKKRVRR